MSSGSALTVELSYLGTSRSVHVDYRLYGKTPSSLSFSKLIYRLPHLSSLRWGL